MERKRKTAASISKELLEVENNSKYPDCLFVNKQRKCEMKSPPKIHAVGKSSVLESVQKFIPEIAKANARLSQENLPNLNMENISENDDKVIEMSLGMFEYEGSSSCDSDEVDDGSEDDQCYGEVNESNIRRNKAGSKSKPEKPIIEEISSS
ncbi:NOP protein chaperone 1-like isoform X2 [Octopus bimaculoides]|uniref:NOP protein chaperone 1-like isoform X2 n=1 Tax=Octopus bimaculoides TaxID=37653 RepID=UPI0022DF1133|nr:NOP protein chaperone 1-like isoform X2 [Octopus bimaculoides]XP_052828071.1 NOP protein chaperone 1-like isoform X2 [Octopus bimaculoides]